MQQAQQPSQAQQHPLQQLIQKSTKIITTQGRIFIGILRGLDQALNAILSSAQQRQYSEQGTKIHQLGTYFIRGDMILLIGEYNYQSQDQIEKVKQVKCKPLKSN